MQFNTYYLLFNESVEQQQKNPELKLSGLALFLILMWTVCISFLISFLLEYSFYLHIDKSSFKITVKSPSLNNDNNNNNNIRVYVC